MGTMKSKLILERRIIVVTLERVIHVWSETGEIIGYYRARMTMDGRIKRNKIFQQLVLYLFKRLLCASKNKRLIKKGMEIS